MQHGRYWPGDFDWFWECCLALHPLVVDLDGTLIHSDMLHESALRLLRDRPWETVLLPLWLRRGKAHLKQQLAGKTRFDCESLPYHLELIEWLKQQKASGRKLVLCTASDKVIAQRIANHLGLFDEVLASDGQNNLAGANKAALLVARYGQAGFDYAGNSQADLAVWACARQAVVVNGSARLVKQAEQRCPLERSFAPAKPGLLVWRRVLRMHQWLKNGLLLVPMLAAHQLSSHADWAAILLAMVAFSLCASSVYIANDLLDLDSDRAHPRKRARPFAAGLVPLWQGVVSAPLLLAAGLALAGWVGPGFMGWLLFYYVLTCLYSWFLKRLMLIDCLTLALLYTLRIVAGAAAVNMPLSFWLLAFSVFVFLSLAFVKRYAELDSQNRSGKHKVEGRGYLTSDAPLIQSMGVASGYAAVLLLALYLNSDAVVKLYRAPELVWGAVPVLLFWISRMWMVAHRGQMNDDPLVFAVKDRASQLCVMALAAVMLFGALGAQGSLGRPW